jgi:hypothetical protein
MITAGDLDDFEDETGESSESSSEDSSYESDPCMDSCIELLFDDVCGPLLFEILVGSDRRDDIKNRFNKYPYYKDFGRISRTSSKEYEFDFSTQYFSNFDKIQGSETDILFSLSPFFSFDFSFTRMWENVNSDEENDTLDFFDAGVLYNRLIIPEVVFAWGVQYKMLNGKNRKHGASFVSLLELYEMNPFSVQTKFDIGAIDKAFTTRIDITARYHINRFRAELGYSRYSANEESINGLNLGLGLSF